MRWIRSASFIVLSLFLHASLAVSWFLLQPTLSASSAESMSVNMVALAAPSGISQSINVNQPVTEIAPKIEPDVEAKLALLAKKKSRQKSQSLNKILNLSS